MASAQTSQGSRRFVAVGVGFLVAATLAMALDASRRVAVTLALEGFVLHVLFGKAYALVPPYFDRTLAFPSAPQFHLPVSAAGVVLLAAGAAGPDLLDALGRVAWALGVAIFVGTLLVTVRDNPTGAETGTGGANAHRAPIDRQANLVLPVGIGYLAVGAAALLAPLVGGPTLAAQQVSHLLAAGTAALFVLGVGFRLFPRFLVADPPRGLVPIVLTTGAVAPALLAIGLFDRRLLVVGGLLETLAVGGFAVVFAVLFARSDRRRVGLYAALCGAGAGVGGVALGLHMALTGRGAATVTAHYRTMLLGFLGLTIVGALFQFYPPAVGQVPLAEDRTALAAIAALAGGLALQVAALLLTRPALVTGGEALTAVGALLVAHLVAGVLARQRG